MHTSLVDTEWTDALDETHTVPDDVVERLTTLVGEPSGSEPPLVLRPGAPVPDGMVTLEGGEQREVHGALDPDFPLGYHRLDDGHAGRALIVSPGRCTIGERGWGWSTQLYATRSERSWGVGDLVDLQTLAGAAARQGASFVMVNPLHAAAPGEPQEASPYSPTSRRFLNPLYLGIDPLVDLADAAPLDELSRLARALNGERRIDRDAVLRLKLRALAQIWDALAPERREIDSDRSTVQFATWMTIAERHGQDWTAWPAGLRHPDGAEVAEFAATNSDRVRFHCWLQHLMSQQLRRASDELAIVQDLPIGIHSTGADAWVWQDVIVRDVSVGAPPDEFNRSGQDWGLPPFHPLRLREADYVPFVETIRATMPQDGGLRIDHVMGLFRLWWIPDGRSPTDGGYVRSFASDLLDIVALESVRRGAFVVGEDLGTVEEQARQQLAEQEILSYRLLWFEEDEPARWPERAMAAITTHDLPTVAGMWDGSDLEEQHALDLDTNDEGQHAIRRKLAEATGLDDDASAEEAVLAAHRVLAQAGSRVLCATLDDACAEPRRPNMPGADREDNWSLALPRTLERLLEDPLTADIAAALGSRAGAAATPPATPAP